MAPSRIIIDNVFLYCRAYFFYRAYKQDVVDKLIKINFPGKKYVLYHFSNHKKIKYWYIFQIHFLKKFLVTGCILISKYM